MAMKLIDRPGLEYESLGHKGLSATASAALHAGVILTCVWVLRVSTNREIATHVAALIPERITWISNTSNGGGSDGGGERALVPPRRARTLGAEAISVPAAPQASIEATIEPPPEESTLPAKPMGDATQVLAGVINSDGVSAGPGDVGVGDSPGSSKGNLGSQPSDGVGPGLTRGGPGVTMPTLIERVSPKYTPDAMRARIQGSVWIECVVQTDGTVGDARILRSLDRRFGLDEEAIAAAKRWRFRPGRLDGQPVPVVITIELMFSVR
jgi:periplasmic protein TonB